MIGYLSVRSWREHGIYVMDADGTNARPLVESASLAMTWWDWTTVRSTLAYRPFSAPQRIDPKALLIGARPTIGKPLDLISSSADRWIDATIKLGSVTLSPEIARWTPDKKRIIFSAKRPVDRSKRPQLPNASGAPRNVHYTLNDYTFVELPQEDDHAAETQVFLMNADGSGVVQLTDPWTEDALEAMPDDDARGNFDPDVSPDGRYVVFTSVSTKIPESYILRMDLQTGEVVNLTAISVGAMAAADSKARWSPDGKRVAFSSLIGRVRQIFVMDADGTNARQVIDDDYNSFDAAWSPDGNQIVFEQYSGTLLFSDDEVSPSKAIDLNNWSLAKVDLRTGVKLTLTRAEDSPVFRPVFSPDGRRIAYITAGKLRLQIDVGVMNADGSDAHTIVTLRTKEEFVDWR
jgi:Tol biopolymer transport system component